MASLLRWGPLPTLGVWSYGIYLWHLPLIRLAQPVLGETLLVAAAAGLASIPVAAASYRYVEQPLQRRRTLRLLSSRPRTGTRTPGQRERSCSARPSPLAQLLCRRSTQDARAPARAR
jgi:peptidoglycan/LPS O-acetylase OafA/YrhL